jgi:hypothetical protein
VAMVLFVFGYYILHALVRIKVERKTIIST